MQKICRGDERLVEARSIICFEDAGTAKALPTAAIEAMVD
jgi:hypothetical protein